MHATDGRGWTLAHRAAAMENGSLELILQHFPDLDLDAQDCDGATPLHVAAVNRNVEVTELLLKHGADTTLTDFLGLTAETRARLRGYDSLAGMIAAAGTTTEERIMSFL